MESVGQDARSFPRSFQDLLQPLGEAGRRWVGKNRVLTDVMTRGINEDIALKETRIPLDRQKIRVPRRLLASLACRFWKQLGVGGVSLGVRVRG